VHGQCLRHTCGDVMFSALVQRIRYLGVASASPVLQKGLRLTRSSAHNSLHGRGKEIAEYRLGGLAWDPGPTICLREEVQVVQLAYQLLLKASELTCWM